MAHKRCWSPDKSWLALRAKFGSLLKRAAARDLVFRFMIQDRGDRTFPEQLSGEAVAAQYRHQRRNVRAGRHPISRRSPEPLRESIPIGG